VAILGKKNPNESYQGLFELAKKSRLPYDKEAWLNLMFYLGEQYVEWGDSAMTVRRIQRQPNMKNTPRPVANKIMHFVNQEHNMVLQTRPWPGLRVTTSGSGTRGSIAATF
jgi:hypothetical protein